VEVLDPGTVELHVLRRDVDQLQEPGLAGAEVVEGETDAQVLEVGPQGAESRRVGSRRLVDLQHQPAARMPRAQPLEGGDEIPALPKLRRMGVDEHLRVPRQPRRLLQTLGAEGARQLAGEADGLGHREQLGGEDLGRRAVAAAQDLVGHHRAVGQPHHGLEAGAHLAALQHLAQPALLLEDVGMEGVEVDGGERRRLGRQRQVDPRGGDQPELLVGEVDDVAVGERLVGGEALAVQEGAVGAPQIAQPEGVLPQVEAGVVQRHPPRRQHQIAVDPPADAEGQMAHRGAPDLQPVVGEAFKVPGGGELRLVHLRTRWRPVFGADRHHIAERRQRVARPSGRCYPPPAARPLSSTRPGVSICASW
jgi:hypothetical protein